MKRRNLLRSLSGILAASSLPHQPACAKELRGKWTKEWIVKYSMSLIDWAKADLLKRAGLLNQMVEIDTPLDFKYFHGTLAKKEESFHARFLMKNERIAYF